MNWISWHLKASLLSFLCIFAIVLVLKQIMYHLISLHLVYFLFILNPSHIHLSSITGSDINNMSAEELFNTVLNFSFSLKYMHILFITYSLTLSLVKSVLHELCCSKNDCPPSSLASHRVWRNQEWTYEWRRISASLTATQKLLSMTVNKKHFYQLNNQ